MIEKPVDIYDQLANDLEERGFIKEQKDKRYNGVTYFGLKGNKAFSPKDFKVTELASAIDYLSMYLDTKKKRGNMKMVEVSSYHLKHVVEDYIQTYTDYRINYISNGEAIFAMLFIGFEIYRQEGCNAIFLVRASELDAMESRARAEREKYKNGIIPRKIIFN